MFTQSVEVALVRELRLFYRISRRLFASSLRILLHLLRLGAVFVTWLIVPPTVVRKNHLGQAGQSEVELPSQRPQWVFGQHPPSVDYER